MYIPPFCFAVFVIHVFYYTVIYGYLLILRISLPPPSVIAFFFFFLVLDSISAREKKSVIVRVTPEIFFLLENNVISKCVSSCICFRARYR